MQTEKKKKKQFFFIPGNITPVQEEDSGVPAHVIRANLKKTPSRVIEKLSVAETSIGDLVQPPASSRNELTGR